MISSHVIFLSYDTHTHHLILGAAGWSPSDGLTSKATPAHDTQCYKASSAGILSPHSLF